MRLNTKARRATYVRALHNYDRAETIGVEWLVQHWHAEINEAAARLPFQVRARLDDENPAPLPYEPQALDGPW